MGAHVQRGEVPPAVCGTERLLAPGGALTLVGNALLDLGGQVEEWDGLGCKASLLARSVVPTARHAAYQQGFNSVRMRGQPFVFAGDSAVVGEYDDDAGQYAVTVYRLIGNSR
eukprot:3661437-Rhodomonas_salina.1